MLYIVEEIELNYLWILLGASVLILSWALYSKNKTNNKTGRRDDMIEVKEKIVEEKLPDLELECLHPTYHKFEFYNDISLRLNSLFLENII